MIICATCGNEQRPIRFLGDNALPSSNFFKDKGNWYCGQCYLKHEEELRKEV